MRRRAGWSFSIEPSWPGNASNLWFLPKGRHLIIAKSRRIRYPVPDRIRSRYAIAKMLLPELGWAGKFFEVVAGASVAQQMNIEYRILSKE